MEGVVDLSDSPAHFAAVLSDSEIVGNGSHGYAGRVFSRIARCTIAHNSGAGIRAHGGGVSELWGSIVYGNRDDLAVAPDTRVYFSDIGDGDFRGADGNILADPLFAAPVNGNYRLQVGSPCIDGGAPDAAPGSRDLAGNPRSKDGDLDGRRVVDMGAYELGYWSRPLVHDP